MAMCGKPTAALTARTQLWKQAPKASGASRLKTRAKVSAEGAATLGNARNRRNQASRIRDENADVFPPYRNPR